MKSTISTRIATTVVLLATLAASGSVFAEGQASRKSDATPVEQYSVNTRDSVQKVGEKEYQRQKEARDSSTSRKRYRFTPSLPATGNDYSESTASENKRKHFGNR